MAFQLQGNAGVVAEVETNTRAVRMTPRPIDVGSLGSYALLASTGTMTAGAQTLAPLFSVRWSDATRFALIRKVNVALMSLGTGFAAGIGFIDMIFARSYTVNDTGGGAVTLTTNNNKRRTSFGTTLFGDVRIGATGVLVAGTRTLDANALAGVRFGVTTAANTVALATKDGALWAPDFSGEWPLVLAQNEGFVVRVTVPATGTWQLDVGMEWSEVTSF